MRSTFLGCLVAVSIACGLVQAGSRAVLARTANGPRPAVSACTALSFGAPIPFWADKNPGPLVTADFNADGLPDLALGSAVAIDIGTVAVRLGAGDGTFGPPARFSVGPRPAAIVAADLNGDGAPDLAVVSNTDTNLTAYVSLLLNAGGGAFTQAGPFVMAGRGSGIVAGDFDGDGLTDLAESADLSSHGAISILHGDGAGGFTPSLTIGTTHVAGAITTGDFDGDGRADLATATTDYGNAQASTIEVRLADGRGGFGPPTVAPVDRQPTSLQTADLNGDLHLDLVSTSVTDHTVSTVYGDGLGGFAPQTAYPLNDEPYGSAIVDLDGDGHLDIAVADRQVVPKPGGYVSIFPSVDVLLADGAGSFGAPTTYPLFGDGTAAVQVVAADLDGDGRPDLAATNASTTFPAVSVMRSMCDRVVDLSVVADGTPPKIQPDERAKYTMAVTNQGPDEAEGVELDTTVPAGLTLESIAPTQGRCWWSSRDVHCALGVLASGSAATLTLVVRSNALGTWTSDVTARTGGTDPNPSDNATSITTVVGEPGGSHLTLTSKADGLAYLSWNSGFGQAGYLIVRYAGGVKTILPGPDTPLPASAVGYIDDTAVQGQDTCYVVSPVDETGRPMERSDMFCVRPGSASATGAPISFSIQTWADGVTMSWTGSADQTAIAIVSYPLDGSAGGSRLESGTTGSQTWTLVGGATCFVIYPRNESGWLGNSDMLCAIPGYSTQ